MTIEDNKAVTRRLHDAVNRGDTDALADLLSDDYREHNAISATTMDKRAAVGSIRAFKNAVPDAQRTLEQQIAEGDYVVDRFMWRGTSTTEFNGVPPGTSLSISVLAAYRVDGGKITEVRWFSDPPPPRRDP